MYNLSQQFCGPCNHLTPRLTADEIATLSKQIPEWTIEDNSQLSRSWKFKNYKQALEFVNNFSVIAEQENHHPDVGLGWGYVKLTITTHAIKGLSTNDFVLAAKIDALGQN